MKKISLTKKLNLNKTFVSNLSNSDFSKIKGGSESTYSFCELETFGIGCVGEVSAWCDSKICGSRIRECTFLTKIPAC